MAVKWVLIKLKFGGFVAVIAYMIGGHRVLIDEEFLPLMMKHRWQINNNGYAVRYVKVSKKNKTVSLHREIVHTTKDLTIDHINGNTLDNRLVNLRICSQRQNTMNQLKRKNSVSKYKGVTPCKRSNGRLWVSQISPKGKRLFLGRFPSEECAAQAYDKAAKAHYGEFAKLNFPEERESELKISATYFQADYRSLTQSKYKGVRLIGKRWLARVYCNGKDISLGSHATEEEAAKAHDKKSWEIFRDPKKLNFPQEYLNDNSF